MYFLKALKIYFVIHIFQSKKWHWPVAFNLCCLYNSCEHISYAILGLLRYLTFLGLFWISFYFKIVILVIVVYFLSFIFMHICFIIIFIKILVLFYIKLKLMWDMFESSLNKFLDYFISVKVYFISSNIFFIIIITLEQKIWSSKCSIYIYI